MRTPGEPPDEIGDAFTVRGAAAAGIGAGRLRGLRIADAASTFAPHLGEYDLVAAADFLLRVPRAPGGFHRPRRTTAFATRDELRAMIGAVQWWGAAKLRRAIERARTGASTRPETWTRLTLVDAGLPEPVIDHDTRTDAGTFAACADLAYPEHRVSIDYEGDGHRERGQFVYDINRFGLLQEIGWTAVRLTSAHVFARPRDGVRRVRSTPRPAARPRDFECATARNATHSSSYALRSGDSDAAAACGRMEGWNPSTAGSSHSPGRCAPAKSRRPRPSSAPSSASTRCPGSVRSSR